MFDIRTVPVEELRFRKSDSEILQVVDTNDPMTGRYERIIIIAKYANNVIGTGRVSIEGRQGPKETFLDVVLKEKPKKRRWKTLEEFVVTEGAVIKSYEASPSIIINGVLVFFVLKAFGSTVDIGVRPDNKAYIDFTVEIE